MIQGIFHSTLIFPEKEPHPTLKHFMRQTTYVVITSFRNHTHAWLKPLNFFVTQGSFQSFVQETEKAVERSGRVRTDCRTSGLSMPLLLSAVQCHDVHCYDSRYLAQSLSYVLFLLHAEALLIRLRVGYE